MLKHKIKEYIFDQFNEKRKRILATVENNLEQNQNSFKKFKKYSSAIQKQISTYEKDGSQNAENFPKIYSKLVKTERMMKKQKKHYQHFEHSLRMTSDIQVLLKYDLDDILKLLSV